jgi:hypothetical protein
MNALESQVAAFHIIIFYPTSLFYCPVIGCRDHGKLQKINCLLLQQQLQSTYRVLFCNFLQCSFKLLFNYVCVSFQVCRITPVNSNASRWMNCDEAITELHWIRGIVRHKQRILLCSLTGEFCMFDCSQRVWEATCHSVRLIAPFNNHT